MTDRIVVAPAGREPVLEEGDVVIRLVPGVAFGTAEHGTTRGCLRLLERLVQPGQRVADIGAGSGILSIAAARLGAGRVVALERDPLACDTARKNVVANGVTDRVEVRQVDVESGDLRRLAGLDAPGRPPPKTRREGDAPVSPAGQDGIVANLETAIILRLLPGFRDALAPGGWLVLSGLPADEPRHVRGAAGALGLELWDELHVDGWWAGCLRRSEARRRRTSA